MGSSGDGKSSNPGKSSPPASEQNNVHVYPDWAAMQAYYGPRVAVPSYFNPAVASGHPPHPYMWGPHQSMVPPYGAPYAAVYAHGGVYAHPGVPLASVPVSVGSAAKSSGNSDQSLVKKLKEFGGLAMSIGNSNGDAAEGRANHGLSHSGETEGSSDGSNGEYSEGGQIGKKRSQERTPINSGESKGKSETSASLIKEVNGVANKATDVGVPPVNVGEIVIGTVISPNMTMALELRNPSATNVKTNPTDGQPCPGMANEPWLQNERELKRERRKQSNRESARRSRLRKQAEAEELAVRVQLLTAENTSLKSEITTLTENSEKLKFENAALMEKLEKAQLGQNKKIDMAKINDKRLPPVGTADLLARVNNSGPGDEANEETDVYDNKQSGPKLYPLLSASPRTDTVAAG